MKYTRGKVMGLLLVSGSLGLLTSYLVYPIEPRPPAAARETFHYPATFVKQLKGDPRAGEKIFKEFCSACHANPPVVPVHAPLQGDKATWHVLQQQGMARLLKTTIQGWGAMPARGGCFECSDEQLRATISYLLKS